MNNKVVDDFNIIKFSNGTKYVGEVNEKGEPHGNGAIYRFNDTIIFEGTFQNGIKQGAGKIYYANGNIKFEGSFDGGRITRGIFYDQKGAFMKYCNGNETFAMVFKSDARHGQLEYNVEYYIKYNEEDDIMIKKERQF